eukprot:2588953-Prymnesium_polylepis.1
MCVMGNMCEETAAGGQRRAGATAAQGGATGDEGRARGGELFAAARERVAGCSRLAVRRAVSKSAGLQHTAARPGGAAFAPPLPSPA